MQILTQKFHELINIQLKLRLENFSSVVQRGILPLLLQFLQQQLILIVLGEPKFTMKI